MPSIPTPSKAGIIENATGERHIPSSVRADGSQRKEIRIRPGYKPPEDVEVYKNRSAETWKSRGSGGIPGAEGLKDFGSNNKDSEGMGKNAKRREARRKARESESKEIVGGDKEKKENGNGVVKEGKAEQQEGKVDEKADEEDPEVERERKVRGLRKKLKQATELKKKKEGGAALLPEQFAKVIKINELVRELDALGFDSEGVAKDKSEGEKA